MRIYKGSNQEVTVSVAPCGRYQEEIENLSLDFFTIGENSIQFSGDAITLSGKVATVVFQPAQLEMLPDGALRYISTFDYLGDTEIYEMSSEYYIKTPASYVTQHFLTEENLEAYVDSAMTGYTTINVTDELSQHVGEIEDTLDNYETKEDHDIDIQRLNDKFSGYTTTSATQEMYSQLQSEISSGLSGINSALTGYTTTATTNELSENLGNLSGSVEEINSGLTELGYEVSVKQDALVAGKAITISGVTISADVSKEELDRLIQHVPWEGQDGTAALNALTEYEAGTIVYRGTRDNYIQTGTPRRNHYKYRKWCSVLSEWWDLPDERTYLFQLEEENVGNGSPNIIYEKSENRIVIANGPSASIYLGGTNVPLPSTTGQSYYSENTFTYSGISGETYEIRIYVEGYTGITDLKLFVEIEHENTERMDLFIPAYDNVTPCYPTPGTYYRRSDDNTSWELLSDENLEQRVDELENEVSGLTPYEAGYGINISNGIISCTIEPGSESGITSGLCQQMIDDAMNTETARTEATYLKEHQSLEDYYTSAQTETAIENALQGYTSSGATIADINAAMDAETARTEATYLKEHQSLENYYTSAQTDNRISESLGDYYTSAQTNAAISSAVSQYNLSALTDYYTSAQTENAISSALTNYSTTADTLNKIDKPSTNKGNSMQPIYVQSSGEFSTCRVSSYASTRWSTVNVTDNVGASHVGSRIILHDAETDQSNTTLIQKKTNQAGFTVSYPSGGTDHTLATNQHFVVDSDDVQHMKKITQADYNTLVSNNALDPYTLYLIP